MVNCVCMMTKILCLYKRHASHAHKQKAVCDWLNRMSAFGCIEDLA